MNTLGNFSTDYIFRRSSATKQERKGVRKILGQFRLSVLELEYTADVLS